jgi:hypothetical protein
MGRRQLTARWTDKGKFMFVPTLISGGIKSETAKPIPQVQILHVFVPTLRNGGIKSETAKPIPQEQI